MPNRQPFKAKRAMLIIFTVWFAASLVAPFTLPSGSVPDLSGASGRLDNGEAISHMNPFAAVIYTIGDLNCHQLKERSFFLNGNEMPFCARDTGIFFGVVLGMLIILLFSPKFSWLALILMLVPIAVDGGVQLVTSYESTNLLRLLTGAVGGAGAAYFLGHFADFALTVKRPAAS